MRMYEVNFAHKSYGSRFSSEKVVVNGFALAAIKKALSLQNGTRKQLLVESVHLLDEETNP